MPNDIFSKILDDKIKHFVVNYSNLSEELFYDEKNNIFHPGEYGKYRENLVKDFIKTILCEDLHISDGFLINNNNQHSTQCDVVIYDYSKTPILKEANKAFIPVETAVCIGEIKSTLSKSEFTSALRKLANNKSLKEYATGTVVKKNNSKDFDPLSSHSDQLFSFLLCKKLNFDITKINFEEIYNGIHRRNRHNVILSLEDGLFNYYFSFDLISKDLRVIYEENGVDVSKDSNIEYPNFLNADCTHNFIKPSANLEHIKEFLSYLHFGISNATILNMDIRTYYRGFNRDDSLFKKE